MPDRLPETHPAITLRLKRAEGHLRHIVGMIAEGRPGLDIGTQLNVVERALAKARRALIHDHIGDCLIGTRAQDRTAIKAMIRLL